MKKITSENSAISFKPVSFEDSSVFDCMLLELPRISSPSGSLTYLQPHTNYPFPIRRVYYLYDIPGGATRGGHAHLALFQLVVAASGSFEVVIDDGRLRRTITLNRPYHGLLIPPGIWRELQNFSSGSICLVQASDIYRENDYIRDFKEFTDVKQR